MADDESDSLNFKEIARLRKKKIMAQSLLIGSAVFMPVSCLGGFGLAALLNGTAQAAFGIAALLAPFAGLAGVLLMWNDRRRYSRSLECGYVADELGLNFKEKPSVRNWTRSNDSSYSTTQRTKRPGIAFGENLKATA